MRKNKLLYLAMGVAGVGLVDSLYLSWIKLAHAVCAGIGDCDVVNTSAYSEIYGIPIALLGAGCYIAILLLLGLDLRGGRWQEVSPLAVFGFSLAGVLYSLYLTWIEVAVLKATCPYCVLSAVALVVLLILSIIRLRAAEKESE
ncbi:MAG: vitamin K epoxide reductase family protein [Chloroflexota bacterium]